MADKKPGKKSPRKEPKGKEDRSVAHDLDRKQEKSYPRPGEKDRQFDNQPEFTGNESNRKDT